MNLFLNPERGSALFFSNDRKYSSPDAGDQGQEMIHMKEDEQNDKDQEKRQDEDKKKSDLEKALECEGGKEKDHQNDEKIIDPGRDQGSQPFCHADPSDPI